MKPSSSRADSESCLYVSVTFCHIGFTVLLPLYLARIENSENLTSTYFKTASALAFVGGVIFEVGSYLMVVEALNR
jgi:hypothetical protein